MLTVSKQTLTFHTSPQVRALTKRVRRSTTHTREGTPKGAQTNPTTPLRHIVRRACVADTTMRHIEQGRSKHTRNIGSSPPTCAPAHPSTWHLLHAVGEACMSRLDWRICACGSWFERTSGHDSRHYTIITVMLYGSCYTPSEINGFRPLTRANTAGSEARRGMAREKRTCPTLTRGI